MYLRRRRRRPHRFQGIGEFDKSAEIIILNATSSKREIKKLGYLRKEKISARIGKKSTLHYVLRKTQCEC